MKFSTKARRKAYQESKVVLWENDKPLVPHRPDHHEKVVGHDMLVAHSGPASSLIKLDP
jgi:hypothetical protein